MRLSGLGGQGVITLGKLLGYGLAIGHDYHVTQTQSYGPEARGGSSRADLVVSSFPISYPKTEHIDLLVALSQDACNTYYGDLKPRGVLVVDKTMAPQTPTTHALILDFTTLAKERIGNPMTLNTIVMGAVTHLLAFTEPQLMRKALEDNMPAKILELNRKAFDLGLREAKQAFGEAPAIWRHAAEAAEDEEDSEIME